MSLDADTVQGVLFLAPGQQQDDARQIWSQLFPSQEPDAYQKASASPLLISVASGIQSGHTLTVNVQAGRITLNFSPRQPEGQFQATLNRITDVEPAVKAVADLMKKLCPRRSVVRSAIVLDLAKTIAPGTEGDELRSELSDFPFPEGATDIVLQFNVRKAFDHDPALQMNRLRTWNGGQAGFVQLQGPGQTSMLPMVMLPYVGLKIDVNTAPELRLASENHDQIIDALVAEAIALRAGEMRRLHS